MTISREIDPVCAMEVDPAQAAGHSEFEGEVYYFCSEECKRKFDTAPTEYAEVA